MYREIKEYQFSYTGGECELMMNKMGATGVICVQLWCTFYVTLNCNVEKKKLRPLDILIDFWYVDFSTLPTNTYVNNV